MSDQELARAVSRILQRSERQEDRATLQRTFVDPGVFAQLDNSNHQILYGRRGTGKTHVLKVLAAHLASNPRQTVAYVDARTLGSSSQFSDPSVPMPRPCLALFKDVISEIHHALLEHIVETPPGNADLALKALDELALATLHPQEQSTPVTRTEATSRQDSSSASLTANIATTATSGLGAAMATESINGREVTAVYSISSEDKVIFPSLHHALANTIVAADTVLFVLVDEWSSLPMDVQPFLAEFLKRTLLPIPRATLKIASLEYRSRFEVVGAHSRIGFELGADLAAATDLDDYYVFDRNPDVITDSYADVLRLHLGTELPDGYLKDTYNVRDAQSFASRLFTERATFSELARASEGVIRDLISIFTAAFFDAQRRGTRSIDRRATTEAARRWFEQDKMQHLDASLQEVLRRIVDEVIGVKHARSFMLPRSLEKNAVIQRLFDARVVHPVRRGYADKDNPGLRYNIYCLDYGTYVDLMGTSRQPALQFLEDAEGEDLVVPFDDRRSIRRIILGEEILR